MIYQNSQPGRHLQVHEPPLAPYASHKLISRKILAKFNSAFRYFKTFESRPAGGSCHLRPTERCSREASGILCMFPGWIPKIGRILWHAIFMHVTGLLLCPCPRVRPESRPGSVLFYAQNPGRGLGRNRRPAHEIRQTGGRGLYDFEHSQNLPEIPGTTFYVF